MIPYICPKCGRKYSTKFAAETCDCGGRFKRKTCPDCGGSGYKEGFASRETCERCEGTGYIRQRVYWANGQDGKWFCPRCHRKYLDRISANLCTCDGRYELFICPDCNGSGRLRSLVNSYPCEWCNETGRIAVLR